VHSLEVDLRFLGVLEKAVQIAGELGAQAAVGYVRSSYRLLSKVYHPDLHPQSRQVAEDAQRRLNAVKQRLDLTSDDELARFLGAAQRPSEGHPRILVVEDDDGLKENLAELLRLEGYHVGTAANGLQGMKAHLSFRPELVITDVVMPIMDGVEMVRQLRQRDPRLRAMFISGFFGTRSIRQDLTEEIDRHGYPRLSKPFRPSQLFTLVRQALL
jgi:CheY-like chemotaxis protein